jgi:purine-binding chemotaxis protein CheW
MVVLVVRLGEILHGIPIEWVEEVLPALPIETVPQCPAFVRGVVSVRGHLIPVLDAAERLGLEGHCRPAEPHIVCVRLANRLLGIEVDEAIDLMDLRDAPLVAAEEMGALAGFFAGVVDLGDEIVRILDPKRLLAQQESAELEGIRGTK